jgi:DNA polymerase IIIc chi subunit
MENTTFYHIQNEEYVKNTCKLIEAEYLKGDKILVRTKDDASQEELNEALWLFSKKAFIPHGSKFDDKATMQDVYITTDTEIPNNAKTLILYNIFDLTEYDKKYFTNLVVIFYGNNDIHLNGARTLYKNLKLEGYNISYSAATLDGLDDE